MSDAADIRFLEHDADLGFEVAGDDLEHIWDRGARALVAVMTDAELVRPVEEVVLQVVAPDLTAAWIGSLTELLVRFEIDGLLLPRVTALAVRQDGTGVWVRFRARGEVFDPARHPEGTGIKAVTHHSAVLGQERDGRWRGRVLLDL